MTAPFSLPTLRVAPDPSPAPPVRGPGVLERIFGGQAPHLNDPQASHRAEQQALITAGLTLASHRGPGALLASLGAGQEAYSKASEAAALEARAQQQEQARQALHNALLESANDPNSLITMARTALAYGAEDTAKALLEAAKLLKADELKLRTQYVTDAAGRSRLINLDTGETIKDYGTAAKPADPIEHAKLNLDGLAKYVTAMTASGYDTDAQFISQYRSARLAALSGVSQGQEIFFKALARIINPDLRRVSDDQITQYANDKGLGNGKLTDDFNRLMKGTPASQETIRQWIEEADKTIAMRRQLFDSLYGQYREKYKTNGLDPDSSTLDFYATERTLNVPGLKPEAAKQWNSYKTPGGQKN